MTPGKSVLNKDEKEIVINYKDLRLNGILGLPSKAQGLIIFAHGSGSSRWSPRNNFVARELQKAGFATLLMDLLLSEEEHERDNVFDIELLAERLTLAKKWAARTAATKNLKVGFFGASTGAGAALMAAAQDPHNVFAVISRGGRPDLAGNFLEKVHAPTLLIVGGHDDIVIDLNRQAFGHLHCLKKLEIIPGATHLFEEPGALAQVANLASSWFKIYLFSQELELRPNP